MTTIGSTSHYDAGNNYSGANKTNAASSAAAFAALSDQDDAEAEPSQASSTEPEDAKQAFDSRPSTHTMNFQGKLVTLQRLEVKLQPINIAELPEDEYKVWMEAAQRRIEAMQRILQSQYTDHSPPDLSNYPAIKPYATVVIGGKVVATIDNQGVVGSSDADAARMEGKIPDSVNGTNGPNLAQARAEAIAKMFGGRVVIADTAMSQGQFNALPRPDRSRAVDYEGMRNDPMYAQIQRLIENHAKTEQQRTEYLAQQQSA